MCSHELTFTSMLGVEQVQSKSDGLGQTLTRDSDEGRASPDDSVGKVSDGMNHRIVEYLKVEKQACGI